jgi:predicted enzyme related to lactoylglutathione lyase
MSSPHGKFGWYELITTDTEAAGSFYSSVIGWTTQNVGSPEMPYITFNVGSAGIAGMLPIPPGQSGGCPSWTGYISVDDCDAYVEKVVAAGGSILKPAVDVPGMLRFAVVTDPQGAIFVLMNPDPAMVTPPNRPEPPTPGTICWQDLMALDGATAFDFYSDTFGWTKGAGYDMGPMGLYQLVQVDGKDFGGIMTRPPGVPGVFWQFYFQVESVKAAAAKAEELGGKILNGPQQVPGGSWTIQCQDPQGANFQMNSFAE